MNRLLLSLLISAALLPAGAVPGLAATQGVDASDPVQSLLSQARLWEGRKRNDLARDAVAKVFRLVPEQPDGLALLARIQANEGDAEGARKTIARLAAVAPGHSELVRLNNLLRLSGSDKGRLRQARMLAKSGRTDAAIVAFRSLYPDGPPTPDLALEYWQLVAATPNGWAAARAGFAALVAQAPDNPRFRLALAAHETSRAPVSRPAVQVLAELAKRPEIAREARSAWRHAVMRLEASESSLPFLAAYLADDPTDSAVRDYQRQISAAVEHHRQLMADPNYRAELEGLSLLDKGEVDKAEVLLQQAVVNRPQDAEAWGGLGLVRLRQGHHAEARGYFDRARTLAPDQAGKWTNLERTAQYWGLLREADDASEGGDLKLAEDKLLAANALDPKEPAALIDLAKVRHRQGRTEAAEVLYRRVLRQEPANASALAGIMDLYVQTGRRKQADDLLARLEPAQRKVLGPQLNALHAGLLRQDAEALQAKGREAEAYALLKQAADMDPDDPWLTFATARQGAKLGEAQAGVTRFDALMARNNPPPKNAAARYAYALYLSGLDRDTAALAVLEPVEPAARNGNVAQLQRRLWIQVQTDRALARAARGRRQHAVGLMDEAERAVQDSEQAQIVARGWRRLGEPARGRALLERRLALHKEPAERLAYASYLRDADQEQEAANQIRLLDTATLKAEDAKALAELRRDVAVAQARRDLQAGRADAAAALLSPLLASATNTVADAPLLRLDGRVAAAQKDFLRSESRYRSLMALDPMEATVAEGAGEGIVRAVAGQGRKDDALVEARRLLADEQRAVPARVALVGAVQDLDAAQAQPLMNGLLATYPAEPRLLAYAGEQAQKAGYYNEAADYLQRSLAADQALRAATAAAPVADAADPANAPVTAAPNDPRDLESDSRYRRLADVLDAKSAWLSSAVDIRSRAGTDGISSFESVEIPVEWRQRWEGNRQQVWRADLVRLDAGDLDLANQADAATFGSVRLCQPTCVQGVHAQSAQGASLNWALQGVDWRADVGTTPVGFRVVNVVGGWLQKGDVGPFSYSMDLSRRPITSSVLSFAGARDPNTGRVWGGVVATGARFGLSKDEGGALGFWSSAGLHQLTGRNVEDNTRLQLMAGAYWRIVNEENRLLTLGFTAMNWHFSKDAGEYSFGHGGYYSPQAYRSYSVPVTYGERYARLSWVVRGAMAVSRSQTDAAPYFPTDGGMQALSGNRQYEAGYGFGHGYSLQGAVEYQTSPREFVGGRWEIERSDTYTPNRLLLYWRYSLDGAAARPVNFPPEAVYPTSQY
ncbi:MAG TPA: cellulose synthase subunit BcsC-related outer membrane protein [Rhodocyclaceae bacterium]|nr:cellulose synthase subunit BcsC-related outer membrane protein [Rhodocyclaceae bacterium]